MTRKFQPHSFGSLAARTPLVLTGQRVGLMGGSFNPPHEGHLIVARTALRRLQLDWLWWLVTPGNPLKSQRELASIQSRKAAIRAMTADPHMVPTSFEEKLDTPYTAATLSFLKLRHSNTHFVWIMGADNLATFHRWQHWRDIAATVPFAVVDRPGWRLTAMASPAARAFARYRIDEAEAGSLATRSTPAWTFLTTRLCSLSSTELRAHNNMIAAGSLRSLADTQQQHAL